MNDLTCPKCGYEIFEVNGEMFTAKGEKYYSVKCMRCGHLDITPEHIIKTGVSFFEHVIITALIISIFSILIYFITRS